MNLKSKDLTPIFPQVPKEGGKYMLTSLAKCEDIEPVKKLVGELFGDGKRR
jgi:hypothetical protein